MPTRPGTHLQQRRRYKTNAPPRTKTAARGYGGRWQRWAKMILRRRPLCEEPRGCTRAATDVHHKIPLAQGGDNSEENLEALCHEHHSARTAREGGVGARNL
ncbi:MAG TPA: HNH endonuclease signature motif containing protein [Phycisphaerae bacterium]|nr:HNH endonuclease signature motif containing protein [Phycisphaerae bacterium]